MGLCTLVLTGVATPFLHNGIMSYDAEDATNFEVKQSKGRVHGIVGLAFFILRKKLHFLATGGGATPLHFSGRVRKECKFFDLLPWHLRQSLYFNRDVRVGS